MHADDGYLNKKDMEELKKVFYLQAYELVDEIQDLALKLEDSDDETPVLRAVQRSVHTLKGDSNSMGLAVLSSLCHKVEDALDLIAGTGRSPGLVPLLLRFTDVVEGLLRAGESGDDPVDKVDTSAVYEMVDSIVSEVAGADKLAPTDEDASAGLAEEAEEAIRDGKNLFNVEISIHGMCGERNVGTFILGQRLNMLGHILRSEPDIASEDFGNAEKIEVVLATDASAEEVREAVYFVGITGSVDVRPIVRPVETANVDAGIKSRLKSEMLRVETSKVDIVIDLLGELVIGRSIVEQIAIDAAAGATSEELAQRLLDVNSYMERTVSDLQKGVMKMRMVPVNNVFRKFPRLVRDIASERDKEVRMEIYGRDTELDKGIVDALGEPLVHLVRNCIDHGIERPQERLTAGKPQEGVVTFRAYHEAARIVIEVSDDGRGIRPEHLRSKAVELGLIGKEEAALMSDREAMNLMFTSGLSTAKEVSDISGRGIGMDAVKSAVENMKGSIEVESTPGEGSTFRLRLPLTLAVIRALLVSVAGRLYAVPISTISEVTRIGDGELASIEGMDTLLLRDEAISMLHLDELIGVSGNGRHKKFALILDVAGRKAGLFVDSMLGQRELVIKAVDGRYARSGLIAGASILGDGRIVFILDAPAILAKAVAVERARVAA